jgi:hypothetical protein
MDPKLLISGEDSKKIIRIKEAVLGFLNTMGFSDQHSHVALKLTKVVFLQLFLNLIVNLSQSQRDEVVVLYNSEKYDELVKELKSHFNEDDMSNEVTKAIKTALTDELNALKSNLKPEAYKRVNDYILNYQ